MYCVNQDNGMLIFNVFY